MKRFWAYIKHNYSLVYIWLLIPVVIITSFGHHRWVKPEGVIDWDVKSYYAYLPALFIHNDLSLEFVKDNPKEYGKWFWPTTTPIGKRCIVTSMGLSILYSPFFFIGHVIAKSTDYATDGYSVPYAFMLHFSALFYLILGMLYLRKFLLKYFSQLAVFLTLFAVFLGTNLFYYTAHIGPMAHAYNFAFICAFIYFIDKWHEKQSFRLTIILGLLAGLITLIRPTNILVLLLLLFWNTGSFKSLKNKIAFFLQNYTHVLLMMLAFFLVWVPQFLYWKFVSGQFLYFSYGNLGGKFFWSNPQIFDILLSYRKGWWVYTPLMLLATIGIFFLTKNLKNKTLAILVFLICNIYVQASWWCWWFGGSFGLRAFIDSYGILAIPLAAIIERSIRKGKAGYFLISLVSILTIHNLFQVKQHVHQAIHYWWMSGTGYWLNFLHARPQPGYYGTVPVPDYDKAREGVYVARNLIDRFKTFEGIAVPPEKIVDQIRKSLPENNSAKRYARNFNISIDSALTIKAWNKYERKWDINTYVRAAVAKMNADSLAIDTAYLKSNSYLLDMDETTRKDKLFQEQLEELKHNKFND